MLLKDKKVEILKQVHTQDESGFTHTTLEHVATVWAYFRQLSAKEVFAAATVNYKEEILLQIGYRTDIDNTNVIRYNGILYDITRLDTFEGYKDDLKLYCSRRPRQS